MASIKVTNVVRYYLQYLISKVNIYKVTTYLAFDIKSEQNYLKITLNNTTV